MSTFSILATGIALTCTGICTCYYRSLASFLLDLFTVGEDHWTWTTRSGELLEEVELEKIEGGKLVLNHKFGHDQISLDKLSEDSRQLLQETKVWQDYLSAGRERQEEDAYTSSGNHTAHA